MGDFSGEEWSCMWALSPGGQEWGGGTVRKLEIVGRVSVSLIG